MTTGPRPPLVRRRRATPRVARGAAIAVAALLLAACETTAQQRAEDADVDASETSATEEPAADAGEVEGAGVVLDGTPQPVAAVACTDGLEITAQLEDGGDVRLATEEDGTATVRIVVDDDGSSAAWAAEDPDPQALTFGSEGAQGRTTVSPVDVDGAPDPDRDDRELEVDLDCGA